MVLNGCELRSRLVFPLAKLNDQFRVHYKFFAPHITHTLNSRKVENNTLIEDFLLIKLTKAFIPGFLETYKLSYYALATLLNSRFTILGYYVCFLVHGI